MKLKAFLFFLLFTALLLTTSCHQGTGSGSEALISMQIIDRNGFTETIGTKDRLNPYKKVDFLTTQPYQKVLRVFSKDEEGKSSSTLTTYHPNGQISQYLDIVDGRAHGMYREWYANGTEHITLNVLDGTADIGEVAQKSWIFGDRATVFDEKGNLLAEFFYDKGVLNSPALHYHPCGTLQRRVPYVNGAIHGTVEVFDEDGSLLANTTYQMGLKEGPSFAYWNKDTPQQEEVYEKDLLQNGSYFNKNGECVSRVEKGNGFQAVFDKFEGFVAELHEFRQGKPEGIVRVFSKPGKLNLIYHEKEGMKHGEEWEYYPLTSGQEKPQPKILLTWHEDALQGPIKTWYPNGVQESSREMHQNKNQG